MPVSVALFGRLPTGAEDTLAAQVEEPATFHPVRDLSDAAAVRDALETAAVVVGDLPAEMPPAPNLRLVQQKGAGVENYDLDAIPDEAYLCNVHFHGPALAEYVFMAWSMLRRRVASYDEGLREGRWPVRDAAGEVPDLRDSTLGVVGFGHIGRALVDPARAFGVDVVAVRGSGPTDDPPEGVSFLGGPDDLDRVLAADAVVLACPLTEATRGLLSAPELERMHEDAVLVNVARGPVVDDRALYEALATGGIAGAAVDTWYDYPEGSETCSPSAYPFHALDNVVMTPHTMGWTDGTASRRWAFVAENIDRVARGERPENVVREPAEER